MDVVQVEGTTLREEDYDAADWTTIIGTYHGKSRSKARMKDLPEVSEKQKAPQERTETLDASPWRPTYRPNPVQLRATQQVTRKSRQMTPLPQHCIKGNSPSWRAVVSRPPETPALWPYPDALLENQRYSFHSDTPFGVLWCDARDSHTRPSKHLRSWLSSRKNGPATLSPFTVEELSHSEPRLWFVHHFLSRDEGAGLRREANELEPTLVTEENVRDNHPDTRTAALA
ncbi:hypothetical protein MTO96_036132 [Rhipicephalus appendiculatus]